MNYCAKDGSFSSIHDSVKIIISNFYYFHQQDYNHIQTFPF